MKLGCLTNEALKIYSHACRPLLLPLLQLPDVVLVLVLCELPIPT